MVQKKAIKILVCSNCCHPELKHELGEFHCTEKDCPCEYFEPEADITSYMKSKKKGGAYEDNN